MNYKTRRSLLSETLTNFVPYPYWYITNIRIIFHTTKFLYIKNKKRIILNNIRNIEINKLYLYCLIKTKEIMKRGILVHVIKTGERFITRSNEANGKIIIKNRKGSYKVAYVNELNEITEIQ